MDEHTEHRPGEPAAPPRTPFVFLLEPRIPLLTILAVFLIGVVVMLLWNAILPSLTGWGTLTYWKAIGLVVLCRCLFGGVGGRRHGASVRVHRSMHAGGVGVRWRRAPSEEERAAMREAWRRRSEGSS